MPLKHWVEMICRFVHASFEPNQPFDMSYLYATWDYTREAKLKCRDDLATWMTQCHGGREEIDVDLLWAVFRFRLEKKSCKSTTRALQLTLQEAWESDIKEWLDIFKLTDTQ